MLKNGKGFLKINLIAVWWSETQIASHKKAGHFILLFFPLSLVLIYWPTASLLLLFGWVGPKKAAPLSPLVLDSHI